LPSNENHLHYLKELKAFSDENKEEEILSIQVFACHGLISDGSQVVATNNYDKESKFYKFIEAETNIRNMANEMSRAYFIVLFACCRQAYTKFEKKSTGQCYNCFILNKQPESTMKDGLCSLC
jgi:hypothetical protein